VGLVGDDEDVAADAEGAGRLASAGERRALDRLQAAVGRDVEDGDRVRALVDGEAQGAAGVDDDLLVASSTPASARSWPAEPPVG
jgi:hypothetical protein